MNYVEIAQLGNDVETLKVFGSDASSLLQQGGARAFEVVAGERFGCVDENGLPVLLYVISGAVTVISSETRRGMNRIDDNLHCQPGAFLGVTDFLAAKPSALIITSVKKSILLAIDIRLFFRIVDDVPGFSTRFLNSSSIRRTMLSEEEKQRFLRDHIYTAPTGAVDGLMNREWLDSSFPAILSDCAERDISVVVLGINAEILFTPDPDVYSKMVGEVSKILHTALRPTDISVYYANNLILTFLINTMAQAATIVSNRLRDRIDRLVIYADMRRQLPHVDCKISAKSITNMKELQALVAGYKGYAANKLTSENKN